MQVLYDVALLRNGELQVDRKSAGVPNRLCILRNDQRLRAVFGKKLWSTAQNLTANHVACLQSSHETEYAYSAAEPVHLVTRSSACAVLAMAAADRDLASHDEEQIRMMEEEVIVTGS